MIFYITYFPDLSQQTLQKPDLTSYSTVGRTAPSGHVQSLSVGNRAVVNSAREAYGGLALQQGRWAQLPLWPHPLSK